MTEPKTIRGWLKYYQQNAPVKVEELCEKLGIECVSKIMMDNVSGYIERLDEYSYKIVYNKFHSKVRQRFTIAHELGHFYLHRDILGAGTGDNKAYRSKVKGYENADITQYHETEANAFAADLMMPKTLIEQWITEGCTFGDIKSKLEMSEPALKFRLKNLNIPLNDI